MAPSTRSTARPSTLTKPSKAHKYDTIKKGRFFNAYDSRQPGVSARAITATNTPS
jgi:hypothetical protein